MLRHDEGRLRNGGGREFRNGEGLHGPVAVGFILRLRIAAFFRLRTATKRRARRHRFNRGQEVPGVRDPLRGRRGVRVAFAVPRELHPALREPGEVWRYGRYAQV